MPQPIVSYVATICKIIEYSSDWMLLIYLYSHNKSSIINLYEVDIFLLHVKLYKWFTKNLLLGTKTKVEGGSLRQNNQLQYCL